MTDLQIIQQLQSKFGEFEYKLNNNKEVTHLIINSKGVETKDLKLIVKLTRLQELNLGFNKITTIDWWLHDLVNLEKLKLSYNKITTTQGLEKLTNLQDLRLNNNKITTIQGLDNLTKLECITLHNNKIPKKEIKEFRDKHPKIIVL